jgi:hypothetical protein
LSRELSRPAHRRASSERDDPLRERPFWSLAIFTIDLLILYGLAAYGGRPRLD